MCGLSKGGELDASVGSSVSDSFAGFTFRHAALPDLRALAELEAACFPAAEAASFESFGERLRVYPMHFWVAEVGGRIVSAVNGLATNERDLKDEMYANAEMHDPHGAWQMIFGVATLPGFRNKGLASTLIKRLAEQARGEGRQGVVLTCKREKAAFYEGLGFKSEGVASSEHGGAVWLQMRLEF